MSYKTFSKTDLIREFNGEEEILLDMITLFEDGLSGLLMPIRDSISDHDATRLKLNAHTMKGVLASFYAEDVKSLAYELEKRGQESSFDDALVILNRMENQLQFFLFELNLFKHQLINQS